jgi:hypothetical protein
VSVCGVESVVVPLAARVQERCERSQACLGSVGHADRNGKVKRYGWRRGDAFEHAVEVDDL